MALKGNKRTVKVNMEGVEAGMVAIPEGDYHVKVKKIEQKEGESSGKPYLNWELEVIEGSHKGSKLFHTTSLQPQALFNLKSTLIALGESVPNKAMNLDLDALEGGEMRVAVAHETYEGKKRARVVEVFPLDEGEEEEIDYSEMDLDELKALCKEREITVGKKDKKAQLVEKLEAWDEENSEEDEGDEDEEDEEEVDLDAMSLEELIAFAEEEEIDLSELSKKDLKKKSKVKAVIEAAMEEEDEGDGEDEEDEEGEEEETPDFDSMKKDELLAWAEENEIKVPAKHQKSEAKLRKYLKEKVEE